MSTGAQKNADGSAPASFVIRNVRIFDGSAIIPLGDVWVDDGKIRAVGKSLKVPDEIAVVDGSAGTLLPGLIDSHTHAYSPAQLKQALVFGVTTELDMFSSPKFVQQIKEDERSGKNHDMADLRSAGTLVTAPGGHGTEYGFPIPTITVPGEAQSFVDARIAEGSDYIKIVYDDGRAYRHPVPTISKETLTAVIAAAHQRGKLAVVHIAARAAAEEAIAAGADALVHVFVDEAPGPQFGAFVAAHHAFIIPTLAVLQYSRAPAAAALYADPRLEPFLQADQVHDLKKTFPHSGARYNFTFAQQTVRQLKAASVPVLAGTDASNPGTAHGASMHDELALLVEAGLTPTEALASATSIPARMFHLQDRGTIHPGQRADLLLVNGDPTADITATRAIVAVWKQGVPLDRSAYRSVIAIAREQARKDALSGPAGSESGLVSDFEDGKLTAKFGAGWNDSADTVITGKSRVELKIIGAGAHGSKGSLQITGVIDPAVPQPWAGAIFFPGRELFAPANLSSKKQVRFWAKGDGKTYRVMIFTESKGYAGATQTFVAGPDWQEFTLPLSAFGTDGRDLTGLLFAGGPATGAFSFQIDDVSIE